MIIMQLSFSENTWNKAAMKMIASSHYKLIHSHHHCNPNKFNKILPILTRKHVWPRNAYIALSMVRHNCNPNYSVVRGQRIMVKASLGKNGRHCLKTRLKAKGVEAWFQW
jgi:hypothetical protein